VRATAFNHLSIGSRNMKGSERVYEDVFGLECFPAYNFGFKTQSMRCGGRRCTALPGEPEIAP
jgi:hypothetical protein